MNTQANKNLLRNIKKNEEYEVYIGRAPKGQPINPLCNPYSEHFYGTRKECIQMFAYDFRVKWSLNKAFRVAIVNATDKTLGCFCSPEKRCHGEVIIAFTHGLKTGGEEKAFDNILHFINGDFE